MDRKDTHKRVAGYALIISATVFFILGLYPTSADFTPPAFHKKEAQVEVKPQLGGLTSKLEALAVYVYDIKANRTIFARNENKILPLASLTKLMTALVASELPNLSQISIREIDLAQEGNGGLEAGESWTAGDLTDFMLVTSSNDASHALASSVAAFNNINFVEYLNTRARELQMPFARFYNESGLDVSTTTSRLSGGYGTAVEAARLLTYLVRERPGLIDITRLPQLTINGHTANNTNILASTTPGLLGGKTGYTELAGGNLAVVVELRPQRPVVIVVLGSSYTGRFSDVQKIINGLK